MGKNTSILLGDYFESYVNQKISSGKYSSVSEVIRSALRLLESEETKTKNLINELKTGEKSGMVENFNRNENLKDLHARHINK
jgi:antitoxin ParD1/3/4